LVVGWYINIALCEAWYSACKNNVLCMTECVGNYSFPITNVNVEGADILADAIFTYNRPPLMFFIILLIILCFGVEFPQLYVNDSYPHC